MSDSEFKELKLEEEYTITFLKDKKEINKLKQKLPVDMTMRQFKSFVLRYTDNKWFSLDKMLFNDQKLSDYGSKEIIVDLDEHARFTLKIHYGDKSYDWEKRNADVKIKRLIQELEK